VLDSWKSHGLYDDFLPGLIDTMKTKNGYAAVPYNLDMRVWWYNKDLLDKAGATPPTDWASYEQACAALKKIGVYGYGTGSGAGRFTGFHQLVSHMINNGGGLFDENQKLNAVTKENIEAMDWVIGLVKQGYVDPRSATYTSPNFFAQVSDSKFGMWWDSQGTPANITNDAVKKAAFVGEPLTGPSGKKGALFFPNNIMMYKNTPSQKGSEAFLTYYYQNMKSLWTQQTGIGLPPLKSIADVAYTNEPNIKKIVTDWQPVAKAWGAPGSNAVFLETTKVDATQPTINFAQQILSGNTTGKDALTTLQNAIK
jgi:multiple sugar transport system substrate-binding protein